MRKIINAPSDLVDEVIEGLLLAHPDRLALASGSARAIVTTSPTRPGRVAIATGGGSGHLPLFLGYVGDGLLSGAAIGNVFSSPSGDDMLAVTRAIDSGGGVLYLYGNYGGDVFNFDAAADRAAAEGIRVRTVLGTDDILSAPAGAISARRGVAGLALAAKTAGAAARRGHTLDQVAEIAQRTVNRTRTMGVGLSPTILPEAGVATFELDDGDMEIGIGIHGEPGQYRGPIETADAIADRFVDALLSEIEGNRVAVLVNGLGATPLEELYLLYRRVATRLAERGISIAQRYIGEYATSLEMTGASVSLCALDPELESLLDDPVDAALFTAWPQAPRPAPARTLSVDPAADSPVALTTAATADEQAAGRTIARVLAETMPRWAESSEELRKLDSALGDGDLGITVSRGSAAISEALAAMPVDAAPHEIITIAARAFGTANPSTFSALIALGATEFAGALPSVTEGWHVAVQSAIEAIQQRGGAQIGDKTLLDPLAAVADALRNDPTSTMQQLAAEAERATLALADARSARGRAAWTGERSAGQLDPGSVAITRLLEALRDAVASTGAPESATRP